MTAVLVDYLCRWNLDHKSIISYRCTKSSRDCEWLRIQHWV